MDINNNQQQNTFESGMNTDTADYVLAKNQYRSSRNVRLVANKGSNSAELHLIDGNSLSFTLDDLDINNNWKILAVNSCRNIGIIIVQTTNKWNIIKITVNDDSVDRDFVFRDGIFTLLNETCVDTVLRYESSENIKLYIADSSNPLLVVNIATTRQDLTFDDIYSYPQALLNAPLFDSIGDDGTLAAGLYQYAYMLYNKNGLSTEMSRTTKLIPLVNSVGNGWYDGYEKGTGNKSIHIQINVGDTKLQKILIYRIKYVENGQMPLIELIADQDIFGSTINFIDSGQSALSTLTVEEFNSTSGVHIIPKCIESKYDYLFAAGIKQQDVDLVDVPDFDTRTYSYRNDGGDTYSAIIDGVRIGTFSTTDDPSTIKTAISNLDDISTTADCIQTSDCKYCPIPDDAYVSGKCKMMYGGIGKNIRWQFIKTSLDADYTNAHRYYDNISHLRDNDRLRDETYMGEKQGCAYDAIHQAFYGDGSLVDKQTIYEFYPKTAGRKASAIGSESAFIRKASSENNDTTELQFATISSDNEHTYYENNEWVNNYITPTGYTRSSTNYGNPKVSYLFKSLRRGETYRFGIIFYNKYGSASKVKWIQDITVPELYEPGFETFVSHGSSQDGNCIDLTVRPLGIKFDIIGELPDDIVGYEIVRCNRNLNNIKNVMLGVLSRPLHKHAYYANADVSSSVYCPSGYLTTARYIQGPSAYYWNRIQPGHSEDNTGSAAWCYLNADNFDNYNVYQFVSAETTYQQESTKSLVNSIGERNLALSGLKFIFGSSVSLRSAYSKRNITYYETSKYYPYQAEAGVIEMGRSNSFVHLPQDFTNTHMSKVTGLGTTYINPYLVGTIGAPCFFVDAISRGVNFLGLDVICDWWGGEHRTSRVPFWWSAIPVNKYIAGPVTEKDVDYYDPMMLNGHSHYNNNGELEITAASYVGDYLTKTENTQYLSIQYIKLYEQSSTITYRTPISLTVGGTSTKTVDSLGHCVNAHAKDSGDDNYNPVYSITDIDTKTTSDFTHTYTASANSISAKIESAHMTNVLEKGGLFNKIETGKAATFNLTETTTHSGVSFFNATIAALYGEDIANDIAKFDQYVYTWGDPTVTRRLTQDFCVGGPCLVIKTSEGVLDLYNHATFSNVSAAMTLGAIRYSENIETSQLREMSEYEINSNTLTERNGLNVNDGSGTTLMQPWYTTTTDEAKAGWTWEGYGDSYGNFINDAYGTYDFQRISDLAGENSLGELTQILKNSIAGTLLCNISHTPQIYSGTGYANRQLDTYYSYGDYYSVDDKTAVVFDGDCYISLLEYTSAHKTDYSADMYPVTGNANEYAFFKTPPTKTVVYAIPLETNINVDYDYGYSVSKTQTLNNSDVKLYANPQLKSYVGHGIQQSLPMYQYNTVYSTNPTARLFSPYTEDDTKSYSTEADYRCYYSNVKENNEAVESWTKFQSSNYIDVDTKYGGITRLRTFNNQLLFWQDTAFGLFDVNEQRVLQDTNNQNLILGEGGVLLRYTYFSTLHGMKDGQLTETHSERQLYWYDHINNIIMMYTSGSAPQELSNIRNVRSYMNGQHLGIRNRVTSSYDKKYNEIYFNIFEKDNLVYNEDQLVFTSVYNSVDGDVYYIDINALKLSIATDNVAYVYEENKRSSNGSEMFGNAITPKVTFISNQPENMVKVFDITTFGGHFSNKDSLSISYNTPHGQFGIVDGKDITDREWDYRVAIPRNANADYGNRLRDKTIECTLSSLSNSDDFSLEYVITKYRLSWS